MAKCDECKKKIYGLKKYIFRDGVTQEVCVKCLDNWFFSTIKNVEEKA